MPSVSVSRLLLGQQAGLLRMGRRGKDKEEPGSPGMSSAGGEDAGGRARLPLDELVDTLQASREGLTSEEARQRLTRYGYNELAEERISPVLKFLGYFWGPIPIMIMIAAVLSGALRHWDDLGIILTLLLMNAIVGFREEYQAGNAIAALKEKLAVEAKAKRDRAWTAVPARELVPGDVIRLRIGDIVPADARLLDGDPVQVDQSALTGESLPVERGTGDTVYSGSIIRQGEVDALVYATGMGTYYGRTAELVETAKTHSHLQRAVLKIADYLIIIALALAVVILMVALFRGDKLLEVVQFALVLTIAAVPVAMPAVLSVTMALGARVLARKEAIVTRLAAVEELAGVDVLCSDKTGTLTQNKLTAGEPFIVGDIPVDQVVLSAALASRAEDRDPIDMAVLSRAREDLHLESFEVVHFQPFDPVHKRTEATARAGDGSLLKVTKGAPQVILALDANADRVQSQVEEVVESFAGRGFRSLGVARTNDDDQWQFLGVIPLYDPLREDSKVTVDTARQMGVNVKMVTGDQIAIAREVGRELGLAANIVDAALFSEVSYQDASRMGEAVEQGSGFAQVFPEHKYHIVEVLQQRGHIVGMTGDGVNDAPALKKADAGIAVSGATDAARAAADIV